MTMNETLNKENNYHKEDLYKIHFFMENGGWWRAYEFSAFLCYMIQQNMNESNRLKVTKKHLKNYGEYVFVGLKLQSFGKYFPDMNIDSVLQELNEKHIVIDVTKQFVESYSEEEFENAFRAWKNGIKYANKPNENTNNVCNTNNLSSARITIGSNTIFGVLQQVLGYPLDDRTPNENTLFIKQLKEQLIKIII